MDLASSTGDNPTSITANSNNTSNSNTNSNDTTTSNIVNPDSNPNTNSNHSTAAPPALAAASISASASALASHANSPDRKPKKSSLTCTTCRARKVRCNGARDICSNCERLGFPCSYDDADPGALSGSLPRRRVRQACLSCHSRKARCSGHVPACERCRAQGIDCVYRPSKRARIAGRPDGLGRSPQSHDGGDRDDVHNDSEPGLTDPASTATPVAYTHDVSACPDESFDALIGRTFEQFFRHIHHIPMFSFLHRASLMECYHSGKVDKSLLFALIGITSYLTDMGTGMREYGEKCIDDAERLLFADYSRPSTIKVQAMVLIIKYRILSKKFPSAFMLLSLASRYASALRLNHECPSLCFLAQESRRRLMWALYCVDAGISGGYRDFALWDADRIHIALPCNERNFEFDLPQPTEPLIHDPDNPHTQQVEDIGSLALHIRIQHMRRRIMEFNKRIAHGRNIKADELQNGIWSLHKDLDDFAAHLPSSFQFSESSLRLRAYSPRICVFVMIHVWWRQCHCDLYRLALSGIRESLPRSAVDGLNDGFIDHCQRQCVEHSLAMANIFSSMHKLNAKPVTDLDLAICAYQCARMLTQAYHTNAHKFDLSADVVMEQAKICLQTIKTCCVGTTADGIKADLEKLIAQGIAPRPPPPRPVQDTESSNRPPPPPPPTTNNGFLRHNIVRSMPVSDGHTISDGSQFAPIPSAPLVTMTDSTFPPSLVADPWASDTHVAPDMVQQPMSEPRVPDDNMPGIMSRSEFSTSEINNAYDGGLDGLGLDNSMDYGMGLDQNLWVPSNDWLGVETLNGGIGA